jgi:AcrR family transcriptional regulator
MREDILDAGIRVLRREGALRFTTPRVAETAGVSVGSLYQYFPNKQSLLFAIHSRMTRRAWVDFQKVLEDPRWSARQKIEQIARLYFLAESADVAEMGGALQEAEIFFDFEDQPEHRALLEEVFQRFNDFLRQALPGVPSARVEVCTELLMTVLESVGKSIARRGLSQSAVGRWADDCAQMVSDYLGIK